MVASRASLDARLRMQRFMLFLTGGKDHNEDPHTKVVVYYCGAQEASCKVTHPTGPPV